MPMSANRSIKLFSDLISAALDSSSMSASMRVRPGALSMSLNMRSVTSLMSSQLKLRVVVGWVFV